MEKKSIEFADIIKMGRTQLQDAVPMTLGQSFGACDFSDAENEIIQLATSLENQCGYCVSGHSAFAANKNVPSDIIQDMRNDQPIRNPKLQALNAFTRAMVREQGHLNQSDFDAFLNAGYSKKQALEVILGISLKTFSNYTSNLINIKLDPMFQPHQWTAASANKLNNKYNTGAIK